MPDYNTTTVISGMADTQNDSEALMIKIIFMSQYDGMVRDGLNAASLSRMIHIYGGFKIIHINVG